MLWDLGHVRVVLGFRALVLTTIEVSHIRCRG